MNEELKLPVTTTQIPDGLELITLGGGCFWCTEAVFQHLEGVEKVISGYSNGYVENPSYREICSGTTGHAEVVQVFFDPEKISLRKILEVFFATHDPTTVNRQGNDSGPQYRSAIFYTTESQESIAQNLIEGLNIQDIYDKKIVTEVAKLQNFYPADDYHQDYYNLNGHQPYCQFIIKPKVHKLEKYFKDLMKE